MSTDFEACYKKGRTLYEALATRLRTGPYIDTETNFDDKYNVVFTTPKENIFTQVDSKDQGEEMGLIDVKDWIEVAAMNKEQESHWNPPYQNNFHRSGKSIACCVNFSSYDVWHDRLHFQHVLFNCFSKVMGSDTLMSGLETIWRMNIANETTRSIISSYLGNIENGSIDFEADTREFFTLLGTDNGKSIARMLQEYPVALGMKTLAKVRAIKRKGKYFMCWFLERDESAPKPKNKLSAAKLRRMAKRSNQKS